MLRNFRYFGVAEYFLWREGGGELGGVQIIITGVGVWRGKYSFLWRNARANAIINSYTYYPLDSTVSIDELKSYMLSLF